METEDSSGQGCPPAGTGRIIERAGEKILDFLREKICLLTRNML